MSGIERSSISGKSDLSARIDAVEREVWGVLSEISNYSRWNPLINHAVLYGQFETGSRFRLVAGKWDFDFIIEKITENRELVFFGRSIGLWIRLGFILECDGGNTRVDVGFETGGFFHGIFKRKIKSAVSESIEVFLSSLRPRVLKGREFGVEKKEDSDIDKEAGSMPTPFNIIYRTRRGKSRKGKSRLK